MLNILLICMGNVCRSPTAESVLRTMAEKNGQASAINLDSAGTHCAFVGERADPRAQEAARLRGYDLSGIRARRIEALDFVRFDQILAMDRHNLAFLRQACPAELRHKLGLFLSDAVEGGDDEIPDPYFGGPEGFEIVLDLCEHAARALLKRLAESQALDA